MRLSVVELSGNVDVFISCHQSFPNRSSYDWCFSPRYSVLMDISKTEGKCVNRTIYYVTVAAAEEPALYRCVKTINMTTTKCNSHFC
jgi:hypothetical protein